MLKRKIADYIRRNLTSDAKKVLIVDGARQVGKSFIIRETGKSLFENYIEINLLEDSVGAKLFEKCSTVEDFYFQLSMIAGAKMHGKKDTLVFLDEIQAYPQLLTLLKFLRQDDRYTYIASGSLLGVTLSKTSSIPMGSIEVKRMYQLDFEEFLWANGFSESAIETLREKFSKRISLDENSHARMLDLFKKYLLAGGMPDAVNSYLAEKNIVRLREIQNEIHEYYGMDAAKYDAQRRLKIKRIYDMIPSVMGSKKKRISYKEIEDKDKRYLDYANEFDYLISSGIALETKAVSTPVFPLLANGITQTKGAKNLLKLYLNDVGLLTSQLFGNNIRAVLDDNCSVNLGSVYETVAATELKAHGHLLWYYDNRKTGEIDFLIDDYDTLSVLPIEIKSGKDYSVHSALNRFVANKDYSVTQAVVLSNEREIKTEGAIIYMPVYNIMFL